MNMQDENGATEPPVTNPHWEGLRQRVISATVMAIPVMLLVLLGGVWFSAMILVAALIMHEEWQTLTRNKDQHWRFIGFAYVAAPCLAFLWLRNYHINDTVADGGLEMVLFLMLAVIATDVGAYFAGRQIGGAKLAPTISPNKTWAGLAGGMIAAGMAGGIASAFTLFPASLGSGLITGMAIAIVAQAGDLFESWLKRQAGVKDSGTLIPGHGGLLDRVDGFVFAAPFYAVLVFLFA